MRRTIFLFTAFCVVLTTSPGLFAQSHENVELVNQSMLRWFGAEEIVVQDQYAYIATGLSGLQIVDISDPENPELAGYYDYPNEATDLAVEGNYAYIADDTTGLWIINISDPSAPEVVSLVDLPGRVLDVAVRDGFAFVAADGFGVIDVSDPENWDILRHIDTLMCYEVWVEENYAYLRTLPQYDIYIADITDEENPEIVGSFENLNIRRILDFAVEDNLAYVVTDRSLQIIDVGNPQEPVEIGYYSIEDYSDQRRLEVAGDLAYVEDRYSNFIIFDVSDPEQPDSIGMYEMQDIYIYMGDFTIIDDTAYLVGNIHNREYRNGLLNIVDVSNPAQPVDIGRWVDFGQVMGIYLQDGYAYIASGESGLSVIDVSDPFSPVELGKQELPWRTERVKVYDNLALAVDRTLYPIDVSDPENLDTLSRILPFWYEWKGTFLDATLRGDMVFTAWEADLDAGIQVFDISDPENPDSVAMFWSMGGNYTGGYLSCIEVVGDYMYVGHSRGFIIADISNPDTLIEIGSAGDYQWAPSDLTIYGDYVYVSDQWSGLHIVDISDPENLEVVNDYEIDGGAWDVAVQDNLAVIALRQRGFEILDVSNPESLRVVGYFDTPGRAFEVAIEGEYIYVADRTNLGIYHFTDPARVDDQFIPLLPSSFILYPAYPNPFNSTTTIRYGLLHPDNVSLQIYDPIGQLIGTLFEGYQQAGVHTTTLKSNNLPSGLYFVQLNADIKTMTQKVMLIR